MKVIPKRERFRIYRELIHFCLNEDKTDKTQIGFCYCLDAFSKINITEIKEKNKKKWLDTFPELASYRPKEATDNKFWFDDTYSFVSKENSIKKRQNVLKKLYKKYKKEFKKYGYEIQIN